MRCPRLDVSEKWQMVRFFIRVIVEGTDKLDSERTANGNLNVFIDW